MLNKFFYDFLLKNQIPKVQNQFQFIRTMFGSTIMILHVYDIKT